MAYRVKRVKHRPIDSRERLPSEVDAPDGYVFLLWKSEWCLVWPSDVVKWSVNQPIYWSPARNAS